MATANLVVVGFTLLILLAATWGAWRLGKWLGVALMIPVVILTLVANFAPYPFNWGASFVTLFLFMACMAGWWPKR